MATSPLFGWEEPDDVDLVKDGAAAIRTLGNAIDTSMGDLLGGTTGQVLSKASNTNMDFTWVTSDDANAIQNTIVDAKGDLIAASASDTPARLAVGNNGETLVADSSTSTGLRYQNAVTVNYAINGGADIWQRGTSFTNPGAGGTYTADRWNTYFNGNGTVTQESTTVPTGSQYAIKLTSTSTNSGIAAYQLIEALNVYPLQGKTVTLSLQLAGTVAPNIGLAYSTTANDTLTNTGTLISGTTIANPTVSTSMQTYSYSFVVPSTAKTLRIGVGTGSVVNGNYIIFGNVQLEIGSIYTRFQRSGGTIQGELAACQRYYTRWNATSVNTYVAAGNAYSTTTGAPLISFPVEMRVAPTSLDTSGVFLTDDATNYSGGTTTLAASSTKNANIRYVHGSASLTALRFYYLSLTATSGYLGLSAEL
jgi:hypothetical protein